ncbi:MAG: allantoinase AllB [Cytophagales bacterium]|nr:allantoinase AllB [Cytophagales bacterium]
MGRFGLHSKRVLLGDELVEATVIVNKGIIERIDKGSFSKCDFPVEDVEDSVIMPGLIDSHVHINEPGRADWEGFDTATRAAAAGGITTLIEMPLNASPVTTTKKAFEKKLAATKNKLHVNCGFWGGIVPENINDLDELIKRGVFGIKAFLTHSGIDEFPNVCEADLRRGLPILKKYNVPLLVHAELDDEIPTQNILDEFPTNYQAYLASRPKRWEDEAINVMIDLCREFETAIHIVHLSSSNSITSLEQAKIEGLQISVETCPHYLVFNAEDIPDSQTQFKCAPPIRERANNEKLWGALKDGLFSFIVSDHSPAIPEIKEMKSGNLKKAWGGIAGLQFSFSAFWTQAKKRGVSIAGVSNLMGYNVARFLHLENRKGRIEAGYDADLTIWNPEEIFEVTEDIIEFKHKITAYKGLQLHGLVEKTFVGGYKVFDKGLFCEMSKGKILKSRHGLSKSENAEVS